MKSLKKGCSSRGYRSDKDYSNQKWEAFHELYNRYPMYSREDNKFHGNEGWDQDLGFAAQKFKEGRFQEAKRTACMKAFYNINTEFTHVSWHPREWHRDNCDCELCSQN